MLIWSENVDEKVMKQWINEDFKVECYRVLSENDIVSRVASCSRKTMSSEKLHENDEEFFITHPKLRKVDASIHIDTLLNYL